MLCLLLTLTNPLCLPIMSIMFSQAIIVITLSLFLTLRIVTDVITVVAWFNFPVLCSALASSQINSHRRLSPALYLLMILSSIYFYLSWHLNKECLNYATIKLTIRYKHVQELKEVILNKATVMQIILWRNKINRLFENQ